MRKTQKFYKLYGTNVSTQRDLRNKKVTYICTKCDYRTRDFSDKVRKCPKHRTILKSVGMVFRVSKKAAK